MYVCIAIIFPLIKKNAGFPNISNDNMVKKTRLGIFSIIFNDDIGNNT